jgi:hypothetical protein
MVVWKVVYDDYVIACPNSPFHEDNLKEWLRDVLKDLKTYTSNEQGIKKVII